MQKFRTVHLRIIETVCCCKHPAGVNEAATTQKLVSAHYVLEDASYPRLSLNLSLASTNNLEVLAEASLATCTLTLLYGAAGRFLNGVSSLGVAPGPAPSIWVSAVVMFAQSKLQSILQISMVITPPDY